MEKMIFIITNDYFKNIFEELKYRADNFGPYSDKLNDQIENLIDLKLIEKKKGEHAELADEFNASYNYRMSIPDKYSLTIFGEALAKDIFGKLNEESKNQIVITKNKFNSMPLDGLLSFVYNSAPPEYLEKSKIKERYIRKSMETF